MTSELRRPIDGVASKVGGVERSIAEARRSTDEIRKSVDKLGELVSNSAAIQSVDLLMSDEIDELRRLVELGDNAKEYTKSRLENESARGMYMQLSDLGFIYCFRDFSGNVFYAGHDPKANWAIARHDKLAELEKQRKAEAEALRKSDRKRQLIDLLIGFVGGIVSALLVAYLTAKAVGYGIPMG